LPAHAESSRKTLRILSLFFANFAEVICSLWTDDERSVANLFAGYKQCSLPLPNWPIADTNCLRTPIPCTTNRSHSPCSGLCRGLSSLRTCRIRTTTSSNNNNSSSSNSRVASSPIISPLHRLRTARTLPFPAFFTFFKQNGGNMNATAMSGRLRGLR
jgi:hypothetical protein